MSKLVREMRQWLKDNPNEIGEAYDIEGSDYQTGENNLNWKGGLRTNDPPEYYRQRRARLIKEGKVILKGPCSRAGENNPNYRHGRYVK